MEGGLLLNSSNEGMVFTQAKFGSSSATSSRVVPVTSWYTGTGSYTYPVVVPGGSGAISSKVYSSTEDSAICYEQLFTQSPDPRPKTPDWTNFICPFTAGDWSEWQASVYATAYTSTGCVYPKSDTPLVRAFYTASSEDALSAYLPVDGFNFETDFTSTSIWSAYESSYVSDGSGSGKYSASTTAWHPISEIVGTETGEMLAAVCVNMAFFNWSSFDSADSYYNWSVGLYSALPPGCAFSGKIQFRRDSDSPSSSAEATAEYTYLYSGTSTATASASSIVYNVPSGSATMSGLACHGTPPTPPPPPEPTPYSWSASGSMSPYYKNFGTILPLRANKFTWLSTASASSVTATPGTGMVVSGKNLSTAAKSVSENNAYASVRDFYSQPRFTLNAVHKDVWIALRVTGRPDLSGVSGSGYSAQIKIPVLFRSASGSGMTSVIEGEETTSYTKSGFSAGDWRLNISGSAVMTAESATIIGASNSFGSTLASAEKCGISIYALKGSSVKYYYPTYAGVTWSASGVYVP